MMTTFTVSATYLIPYSQNLLSLLSLAKNCIRSVPQSQHLLSVSLLGHLPAETWGCGTELDSTSTANACIIYLFFLCVHEGWQGSKSFSATISNSGIRKNQVLHGLSSTCRQPVCDVKASPAFILTRGEVWVFVSCAPWLFHVSMLWITPGQCKWPPPSLRLDSSMCIFACLEEIVHWVTSEFPKGEVEIRFSDSWGSTPDRMETASGRLEKFQPLHSSCTAYLIHT